MKTIAILNANNHKTIYSARLETIADCIEHAINDGVSLAAADLRGAMLAHANLDGADFSGAVFDGADLTGANLSECNLTNTSFRAADLSLSALCESNLTHCNFADASFSGTLLSGTMIENCAFTCPSTFTLPFWDATRLGRNFFGIHVFTAAPVVVTGLPKRIVFLDDVAMIGDQIFSRADFPNPFQKLFQHLLPPRLAGC